MGYTRLGAKSVRQLQKHIRQVAAVTGNVAITAHAKQRMAQRHISRSEVFECLRCGSIHTPPEPNPAKGSLEARMEYFIAGRTCKVVVAVCDEQPDMLVVTVML